MPTTPDHPPPAPGAPDAATAEADRAQRLRVLRGSIKLLVAIGFIFLLVPFVLSLPWPRTALPPDATLLPVSSFAPGETRAVTLRDGHVVMVTRGSPALAAALERFPGDLLWSPSAPGLAAQDWFVLPDRSALDEPVRILGPRGQWPGGFVAPSGAAWDVAGRALKPWPGHPGGYAMTVQNLLPLPWRVVDGQLVLLPLPEGSPYPQPATN